MDNLYSAGLQELLSATGAFLEEAGRSAAIVVVGGGNLAIRGWVERTTQDIDVIAQGSQEGGAEPEYLMAPDPLSQPLRGAIARVARDFGLPGDWMNTVVGAQWESGLPPGFYEDLEWKRYGGLVVGFAGRQSQIALKLHAAVDRDSSSVHFQDLIALKPTASELNEASIWVMSQDAGESFPALVKEVVDRVLNRPR